LRSFDEVEAVFFISALSGRPRELRKKHADEIGIPSFFIFFLTLTPWVY